MNIIPLPFTVTRWMIPFSMWLMGLILLSLASAANVQAIAYVHERLSLHTISVAADAVRELNESGSASVVLNGQQLAVHAKDGSARAGEDLCLEVVGPGAAVEVDCAFDAFRLAQGPMIYTVAQLMFVILRISCRRRFAPRNLLFIPGPEPPDARSPLDPPQH
jgi:hypothetical protein